MQPAAAPRILVVEDDPIQQRAYAAVGKRYGLDVQLESRTTDVLRAVLQSRPDAVILDLNVEDGNTLRVLSCLRESPETARTPVAIISANLVPEIVQYVARYPGVYQLAKPWRVDALLELTSRMTGWVAKG